MQCAAIAALFGVSFIVSLPVNINRFSTHFAYRNRLVRTFLGASDSRSKGRGPSSRDAAAERGSVNHADESSRRSRHGGANERSGGRRGYYDGSSSAN